MSRRRPVPSALIACVETLYTGRLARAVIDDMQANGGLITLDDLANYSVCERDPVRGQYRGYDILSAAPPSVGNTG
jgi:gamma-glutamyltranspeptidase / glutathione hydrolase